MFEIYWSVYFDVVADANYYNLYAVKSKWSQSILSAVCLIASCSSVALWFSSIGLSSVWAIILLISQLVMIMHPVFPFEKRIVAANYITKELRELALEMENQILEFDATTNDKTYTELIREAREKNTAIQFRFADADTFPKSAKLMKKASEEAYKELGGS